MEYKKVKKNKTRLVKFTEEEWEQILKCADENGMKVGTYIQTMATSGKVIKYNFDDNKISKQLFETLVFHIFMDKLIAGNKNIQKFLMEVMG